MPHPTVPWETSLMNTQGMRMASQVPNCPAMCYMPLFCPRDEEDPQLLVPLKR